MMGVSGVGLSSGGVFIKQKRKYDEKKYNEDGSFTIKTLYT